MARRATEYNAMRPAGVESQIPSGSRNRHAAHPDKNPIRTEIQAVRLPSCAAWLGDVWLRPPSKFVTKGFEMRRRWALRGSSGLGASV